MEATLMGVGPIVLIAGVLAFYMAWAIGANDVANAMGTSVGSGSLSIRNAVIVAGILEFCGAFFVGGHVTDTVRKGILTPEAVSADPQLLLYGMLGALAAAATLLVGATKFGLPVSTTHAIVGASLKIKHRANVDRDRLLCPPHIAGRIRHSQIGSLVYGQTQRDVPI